MTDGFDRAVAWLDARVGERVQVTVAGPRNPVAPFAVVAGLVGMLRRAEPEFVTSLAVPEVVGDTASPPAVFYIDGGQGAGFLPWLSLSRGLPVGCAVVEDSDLPPDHVAGISLDVAGVAVTVGHLSIEDDARGA